MKLLQSHGKATAQITMGVIGTPGSVWHHLTDRFQHVEVMGLKFGTQLSCDWHLKHNLFIFGRDYSSEDCLWLRLSWGLYPETYGMLRTFKE